MFKSEKMKSVGNNFGFILKRLRSDSNLTQADVAHKSELAIKHYQDIENNQRNCTIKTLSKILSIYGLGIFNFMDYYFQQEFQRKTKEELSIFKSITDFYFFDMDFDGKILSADDDIVKLVGYTQSEVTNGMYIWDFLTSELEIFFNKNFVKLLAQSFPLPFPELSQ